MSTLNEAELAQIAKNRERAKNIRAARLVKHPYARVNTNEQLADKEKEQTKTYVCNYFLVKIIKIFFYPLQCCSKR